MPDFQDKVGGEENGGDYLLPARPAVDDRWVQRRHSTVWRSLAERLSEREVKYQKWRHQADFEIDLEIARVGKSPPLVEIKSDISISTLYTAVGRLHLREGYFLAQRIIFQFC